LHAADRDQAAQWVNNLASVLRPEGLLLIQCQTVDHLCVGEDRTELQVLHVLQEAPRTEVFLRRTCYRWKASIIEKAFIRVSLSSGDCRAEEYVTRLQMLRRSDIELALAQAGLNAEEAYGGADMRPYVSGTSDGLLVIAKRR
jgi:hypothetical protein